MEASSSFAFRRNLEPVGSERRLGAWRISSYADHVSERRFLLSSVRMDASAPAHAETITFRARAAHAAAPAILPVIDVLIERGKLELLTACAEPIDPGTIDDAILQELFAQLLDAVFALERHALEISDLGVAALALGANGNLALLPCICALPPMAPKDTAPGGSHVEAIGSLMRELSSLRGAQTDGFAGRLTDGARMIASGEIVTLSDLSVKVLAREIPIEIERPVRSDRESIAVTSDQIAQLLEDHSLVELSGPASSGRTSVLHALHETLTSAGISAQMVDEWSDVPPVRRKGSTKEKDTAEVWLVDDAGEKPSLLPSTFARVALSESPQPVVWAIASDTPAECEAFLRAIRSRAAGGSASIPIERSDDGTGRLRTAMAALDSDVDASGDELFPALLSAIDPDEHRVLELTAVARIALPLSLVSSVFANDNGALHKRVSRLATAGLLEIRYRPLPPSNEVTATLSFSSASLRRAFYRQIPEERREVLHRTIARLAAGHGGFPQIEIYRHLVLGVEHIAAARSAITFLRETPSEHHAPYLDMFVTDLIDTGQHESLEYGERLSLIVPIASDLLARGKQNDAERLLLITRQTETDSEDVRSNAEVISEATRLLSDIWTARSNYTQALDLLYDARESLGAYLSLAGQAQLMNEIGWLLYRLGDYDSSVDSCKLSLNTLNPNEHPLVVAQALNLMGVIHFNTSRYNEAISYYEQSAILREKHGDLNALAGSYNNLALAYQAKGEYDKALGSYEKSLDIKKKENNEAGIAAGYLNQALLHLEVHNFEEAERKCRDSLRLSEELDIAQLIAENHATLGDIALTRGRFDEAEQFYRKSLELARSLEITNEEMGALRRLAHLYLTRSQLSEARESVDAAARLASRIGSKYETARIEEILGDINFFEGHYATAIDFYEKAASGYATVSKYRMAAAALARIGQAHVLDGNSFEAKHYLDRATEVIRSEIVHEIPDEIVTLRQMLRERPVKPGGALTGSESQKLLYAFYELSSLSEYADDKVSFFKRVISVFQDLTGSASCYLALQAEENTFVRVDAGGEQQPLIDPGLRTVLVRSLQLGTLLHSLSEECTDIQKLVELPNEAGFVVVPMKSMGRNLGCVVLEVMRSSLPLSKEDVSFVNSLSRHVAGDLRLTFHLEEHAHKEETLEMEFESLKAQVVDRYHYKNLIGKDESMKKIFRTLDKVKDMDTGILIIGESGTGKTELARTIHYSSPRRNNLFQQIHCAEIPTNLLESELFGHERGAFTGAVQRKLGRCEVADGGTIFLDDVNVMPTDTQAKLLHYLESKSFMRLGGTKKIVTDVRIIAASNEDLEKLSKEGRFREDLFYRLKVIQIELPPLRERPDDMIAITQAYLKRRCQEQGITLKTLSTETIKLFRKHPWAGNVRELQNVLEQIVLLSDEDIVEPVSLPDDFLKRTTGGGGQSWQSLEALAAQMVASGNYSEASPLMPQLEAMLARKMADHVDGKGRAASLLGITKPTLYNRLRGYDKMK